jgi:hypothetical protein
MQLCKPDIQQTFERYQDASDTNDERHFVRVEAGVTRCDLDRWLIFTVDNGSAEKDGVLGLLRVCMASVVRRGSERRCELDLKT